MEWIARLTRRKAAFVYPVLPAPRTAVLEPWFRPSGNIQIFEPGWCKEAADYMPAAVAGSWQHLEPLLGSEIDSLTHAVIVLARPGDDFLTLEQRRRLWRAFRVPVFEQVIGENGALLAFECEAHCGMHIASPKFKAAGRAIEAGKCGCGLSSPRLKLAERSDEIRATAAYAR